MAASTAVVTVRFADPLISPEVAVITVVPLPTPVASPLAPGVLLIVATAGSEEVHCTELVTFCWDPSLNVPIAVNAWLIPTGIVGFAGATEIESSVGVTFRVVVPLIEFKEALIVVDPSDKPVAKPVGSIVAI